MILAKQLGMIPSWQYDTTWKQNPKYNNHVVFPEGWNQLTPQPVGPYYAPPEGLGRARSNCCDSCTCTHGGDPCCQSVNRHMLRGPLDLFESPLWTHRKWLIVGGVALLGLAVLGGATAILR